MHVSRRIIYILLFISAAGAAEIGYGNSQSPSSPELTLEIGQNSYALGPFLEILEDETGKWRIQDVASEPLVNEFVRVNSKNPNLGLSESAFWFRFTLHSKANSQNDKRWFFKIDRCGLTGLKLFIPKNASDQTDWQILDQGRIPLSDQEKSIICQPLVYPLPGLTIKPKTFYVRLYNPDGGLYFPVVIATEEAIRNSFKKKTLWLGVYYGTIIALLAFNLYLYISLREIIQLYYIFYISSVIFYFLFINGIFLDYFTDVILHDRLNIFALGLTIFWGTYFAKSFLKAREYAKYMDKVLVIILIASAGTLVLAPFASLLYLNQVTSLLGMMSPIVIIVTGLISWRNGFKPILFFMVAWTILCLGGLVYALTYRGALPYSSSTFYSFQIGSCLEVVILSFALGERLRGMRHERDSIRSTFGKYVSDKVCDEILSGRISLNGESKEVTVLISDLRNYTPLVESTPPKDL